MKKLIVTLLVSMFAVGVFAEGASAPEGAASSAGKHHHHHKKAAADASTAASGAK